MSRVNPINKITDIKLKTFNDIADDAANTIREMARKKPGLVKGKKYSSSYAEFKKQANKFSNNTSFIDLTLSGSTLESYMRRKEVRKNIVTVGFTSREAANVARGWEKKGYNLFQPKVVKHIKKTIQEVIGKELKANFNRASGRITITI